MKILAVGDDNFTLTPCILGNIEQWSAKVQCTSRPDAAESEAERKAPWKIEVACCLPLEKIPAEYMINHDKLVAQGVNIHYSVNPALLRQYFTTFNNEGEDKPGPPYDVVLCVLPGLQFDGLPRFVDRKSELFKLRLHMYFFALTKSSTVITKKNGAIMFLWVDQDATNLLNRDLPFPLVDIHKLGPFCKIHRSPEEDFRLNLSWGDYKTRWKPILHNVELLNFPSFLEDLKVYVFRNSPYVEKESQPIASTGEENNLLRIPQSICQWNRTVLSHVNELFHFNMRTSVPGESLQISKLSVKYDPRINGWRNLGTVQRTDTQRPTRPVQQQQQPRGYQDTMQQQPMPALGPIQSNAWPGQTSTYGAGYAEPVQRYPSYASTPPYETGLSSLLQGWPTQQPESASYNPYAPVGGQSASVGMAQSSEFDMYAPPTGQHVSKQPEETVRRDFDRKVSGAPVAAHASERSGYDESTRLYEDPPARSGYEPTRRDSWPRRSDPGPYSRRKPRREVYDDSRRSERYHGGDDHDRGRVYR